MAEHKVPLPPVTIAVFPVRLTLNGILYNNLPFLHIYILLVIIIVESIHKKVVPFGIDFLKFFLLHNPVSVSKNR